MHQMSSDEIRSVVVETLAEQQKIQQSDIEAVVVRAMATILASFGIEEEDRRELRADFQHLRRWRKSVKPKATLSRPLLRSSLPDLSGQSGSASRS